MLGLPFSDNSTHWLRNVIRAHWRVLLACSSIVTKVHLIHIVDAALPHLVLGRHWHRALVLGPVLGLHYLHLLITEVAHFIIMHYRVINRCY